MIHPEGLLFRFYQVHMQGLSAQTLSAYRTENPRRLPRLPRNFVSQQSFFKSEKQNISWRPPTKSPKQKNWLVEKKHPPTRLFLIKDFPSARVLFSVMYVMFSPRVHQHRYTQGQWTPCCVRTAVTLTNPLQQLLHVWSLLNVHADGMWRAERKHLKTRKKFHNNLRNRADHGVLR